MADAVTSPPTAGGGQVRGGIEVSSSDGMAKKNLSPPPLPPRGRVPSPRGKRRVAAADARDLQRPPPPLPVKRPTSEKHVQEGIRRMLLHLERRISSSDGEIWGASASSTSMREGEHSLSTAIAAPSAATGVVENGDMLSQASPAGEQVGEGGESVGRTASGTSNPSISSAEPATQLFVALEESPETIVRGGEDGKEVTAGTPDMLVQSVVDGSNISLDDIDTLLYTHTSWTTSLKLFRLLLRHFHGMDGSHSDHRDVVRFQVHFVLRRWIEQDPEDFLENDTLYKNVESFVGVLREAPPAGGSNGAPPGSDRWGNLSKQLANRLKEAREKSSDQSIIIGEAPLPRMPPKQCTWADIDALEIARQLTLMDAQTYRALRRTEFLNMPWSKARLKHLAKNVLAMTQRFNTVSFFFVGEIVKLGRIDRRRALLEKLYTILDHLLDLSSFNTAMAVFAACNHAAVHRLKVTKSQIPRKIVKRFEQRAEATLISTDNYARLREVHAAAPPPKMQYLGMYLSDLTFISDGNPDYVKEAKLVNFSKQRMEHAAVVKILADQKFQYNLHPLPRVQELLSTTKLAEATARDAAGRKLDDYFYEMSLKHEPRGAKLKDLL